MPGIHTNSSLTYIKHFHIKPVLPVLCKEAGALRFTLYTGITGLKPQQLTFETRKSYKKNIVMHTKARGKLHIKMLLVLLITLLKTHLSLCSFPEIHLLRRFVMKFQTPHRFSVINTCSFSLAPQQRFPCVTA